MTISTRKERQKEELRGKILQAAKELFMKKGFEDTSIRNIAEKNEYSPTTMIFSVSSIRKVLFC